MYLESLNNIKLEWMYERVNTWFGFSYWKHFNQLQHQVISGTMLSFTRDLVNTKISFHYSRDPKTWMPNQHLGVVTVGVSRGYTDHHQGRAIHMADSRID